MCQRADPTVRSRGLIDLMAEMCERCWNRLANGLAVLEGATAPSCPVAGQDGAEPSGPARCGECGGAVGRYPTCYERWVDLATFGVPAGRVPERFRWRLLKAPVPSAPYVIAVRALDPLPGDPVVPAHAFLCPAGRARVPGVLH